jgi:hypothetical protein
MNHVRRRRRDVLVAAALLLSAGCGFFAVKFAPKKTALRSDTELAGKARSFFHESLAAGRYDDLPEAMRLLTAAYLESPRDPSISFLLGMAHLWRIAERFRQEKQDPTITDQLILADKYLSEARRLDPTDFRIAGFEGSVKMALGSIHQDEALKRQGYFILKDGMRRYPEFNLFTMSFVLANAPRSDPKFADAVDYAWKNVEACVGHGVGRTARDVASLSALMRNTLSPSAQIAGGSADRACRNPPTAPHNMEGFFLHMGDLLVKKGDVETAREIYKLARIAPSYSAWPFAEVLEKRIAQAPERARLFAEGAKPAPEILFQSSIACVACHQERKVLSSQFSVLSSTLAPTEN